MFHFKDFFKKEFNEIGYSDLEPFLDSILFAILFYFVLGVILCFS